MIKRIYFDFDGCLTAEYLGSLIDLEVIQFIRDINKKSINDSTIPSIAINSGRPQAYIEAHTQTFDIRDFCIFESGAGIFRYPYINRVNINKNLGKNMNIRKNNNINNIDHEHHDNNIEISHEIEIYLDKNIPQDLVISFHKINQEVYKKYNIDKQPNKDYSLTYLFKTGDELRFEIADFIKDLIEKWDLDLYIDVGSNFVNINVKNVNKGTGLKLVCEKDGLSLDEIAGVGDSIGDYSFMELCGFKACPSNAPDELKEKVDFFSEREYGRGAIDIIKKVIEINKE